MIILYMYILMYNGTNICTNILIICIYYTCTVSMSMSIYPNDYQIYRMSSQVLAILLLPVCHCIHIYINIVLGRHDIQAIHDIITATSTTTMTAHVYLFYHYLCFLYAAMPIYLILLIYCPNIQLPSSKYNHPGYIPNILRDSCPNHHHSSDVAVRWLIVKGLQLILLEVLLQKYLNNSEHIAHLQNYMLLKSSLWISVC